MCLNDSADCGFRIRPIGAWLLLLVGVLAETVAVLALIHETNSKKNENEEEKEEKLPCQPSVSLCDINLHRDT